MTREPTRSHFHSSQLVRTLTALAAVEVAKPTSAFAEKLSLWIDFTQAINLSAVNNGGTAIASSQQIHSECESARVLAQELACLRDPLERAILASFATTGKPRHALPTHSTVAPTTVTTAFSPYRKFHLAHQRDMDSNIKTLRAKVREKLTFSTAAHRQLATLDAALEKILFDHENRILSTVPLLLQKRFTQLATGHEPQRFDASPAGNRDPCSQTQNWESQFIMELQEVLLAELDLRLQPTLGLLEALHNQNQKHG